MTIDKNSGQIGWEWQNLHITTKFTQQQKYCHSKQTMVETQEWDSRGEEGGSTKQQKSS